MARNTPPFLSYATPLLCSAFLFVACEAEKPAVEEVAAEPASRSIETIADEVLAAMLIRKPSIATNYSIAGARHDHLFDNSLDALAAWQEREDAWLEELDAIGEPSDVGSREWVTFGIMYEQLAAEKAIRVCRKELWETSTTTGWYTRIPFVFNIQPLATDDLKQQALARLREVDQFIDTEVANLREGLEMGYSSPRLTVAAVPGEVRALRDSNSPFLTIGARADDEVFEGEVQTIFDEDIVPAINRYAKFIEAEYLDKAREELAVTYNPDGAECYPALVRSFATIQPTADEIHETGLAQISKIRGEMQEILAVHFESEAIENFLRRINADPEFTFESEDEVLQYSIDSLDAARKKMPDVFGLLPNADVVVKPYPAFAESGSGEYHSSSEDGTRPGIFYIAVRDPESRSRGTQLSTLYHETYPGHHLQGAIALELGDSVHALARYLWNSGYGEGWALYAERVAQELDLYPSPLDLMGLYSDQAARAARLVIDSGIHSKAWTRQQAVDYMMNNTAWSSLDIQNEINRYISWPGQANSYMLGMLEIRRLRTLAEVELGEQFDLRDFHDRILENGSMTLPMTEKAVLAWIEKTKQD
jgi:uncharacterized protein (DUF885 family)